MQSESVPVAADLLLAFVNTVDHELGTDGLDSAAGLREWLRSAGLVEGAAAAGSSDLELARELRDGLRQAMGPPDGAAPERVPALDRAADALPVRVTVVEGLPRLEPLGRGVRQALASLLVAVEQTRVDGTWSRLKICPAEDCRWAFYDASKNRTRVWCAMGVCGNRTKTRAYRARRRAEGAGASP